MNNNVVNNKKKGNQLGLIPKIGDIVSSKLLGQSEGNTMIYSACKKCGHTRWVRIRRQDKVCAVCSQKEIQSNPETNRKKSESLKGYREFRFHKGKKRGTKLGHKCTPAHIEKVRQASLKQWATPETRDRLVKAILEIRSPNKTEVKVLGMLNKHLGNEWAFVGDGQVIIGGCCPDYINTNGKKLIVEFYGDFFHRPQDEGYKKKLYAKFGYDTFAIWSKDMQNHTNRTLLFDRLKQWVDGRIHCEEAQMVLDI